MKLLILKINLMLNLSTIKYIQTQKNTQKWVVLCNYVINILKIFITHKFLNSSYVNLWSQETIDLQPASTNSIAKISIIKVYGMYAFVLFPQ
jgi:hypothetical protein